MNKRSLTLAGTALIGGVAGLILRRLQLLRYDAETGLFQGGGVAAALLIFVLAAAAVVLLVLSISLRGRGSHEGRMEPPHRRGFLPVLAACAACVVTLFGALMLCSSANTMLYRILAVLCMISAFSAFVLVFCLTRGSRDSLGCVCGVVTVLFYCFWLIVSYKDHAADPVVWVYAPEILAISATLLGFYYLAGYPFGRAKPYWTEVFCGLSVVFSLTTLPDERSLGLRLMLLGPAVLMLCCLWMVSSGVFTALPEGSGGPGAPSGPGGPGGREEPERSEKRE